MNGDIKELLIFYYPMYTLLVLLGMHRHFIIVLFPLLLQFTCLPELIQSVDVFVKKQMWLID